MKIIIFIIILITNIIDVYSQNMKSYRMDTLCIEQAWKTQLTGTIDDSYICICVPETEIIPDVDLNHDRIVITCTDGSIIRLFCSPQIPSQIEESLYDKYNKDSVDMVIGSGLLRSIQEEMVNFILTGVHIDSSLYCPKNITYEGFDSKGKCWRLIKIEYITVSYENVPLLKKQYYDSIIDKWHFLSLEDVKSFHPLPLYQIKDD